MDYSENTLGNMMCAVLLFDDKMKGVFSTLQQAMSLITTLEVVNNTDLSRELKIASSLMFHVEHLASILQGTLQDFLKETKNDCQTMQLADIILKNLEIITSNSKHLTQFH